MKTILISCLTLLIAITSKAQFSIGFVGLPQITSLSNKAIRHNKAMTNRISYDGGIGVAFNIGLSDKITFQPGLLYSEQNQRQTTTYTVDSSTTYNKENRKRFDYLKIPLLLKISKPLGRMKAIFFAGPQVSYLIKYDGGVVVYIENIYFDILDTPKGNNFYKNFTFDVVGGLGLEMPLSNKIDFTTAFRMDCNLTNAQNNNAIHGIYVVSEINGSESKSVRNKTFALMLGLNYKFKKSTK